MDTSPALPDAPFTWPQARRVGLSRALLTELVSTGVLRRVLHNVYQRCDVPDTTEARALAAGLVVTPFGVFVDRTAAWLQGVDVFDYPELEILPRLETVVLRGHHRVERAGCAGGERDLRAEDVCRVGQVRVTTPLRTALDLGCRLGRWDAVAALDAFMRLRGVTRDDMVRTLPRYRGRRGVVQLRQLVPLADARAESPGESWTRIVIHDDGIPLPEPQYWVTDHGRPLYRLDLAYPKSRVVVEYDGLDFHDKDDEQREADRKRRTWLRDHGWTVIVVGKESFSLQARSAWLAELREALGLRR